MIKLKFFGLLRLELGISELEVDSERGSLLDILQQADSLTDKDLLSEVLETDNKVKKGTIILLNGRNIRYLEGISSEVKADDEISIFPLCGGG